ncbi:MAG: DUF4168 domain-containing protein [Bacteroidales bacterium]
MNMKKFFSLLAISLGIVLGGTVNAQDFNSGANQNQQQMEISDEELQNFVEASQEIQMLNNELQDKMVELIENSDMGLDRFQEISQMQQQGQDASLSEEEESIMASIQEEMQKEQQAMRPKMDGILEDHGLDAERYMAISRAMQTDEELQQRYQEMQQELGDNQQQMP